MMGFDPETNLQALFQPHAPPGTNNPWSWRSFNRYRPPDGLPAHWHDVSYVNDVCPSWDAGLGVYVYADYERPEDREFERMPRYCVHHLEPWLGPDGTNEWQEPGCDPRLDYMASHRYPCFDRLEDVLEHVDWYQRALAVQA